MEHGGLVRRADELWARWKKGETASQIARAFGANAWSVGKLLARHGGIAPPPRHRSSRVLDAAEREEISRGLAANRSLRELGRQLGRAPSTISREVRRNGGLAAYRAGDADQNAWERARRPKPARLATDEDLRHIVESGLKLDFSPQQIARNLKLRFPNEPAKQVSHETIYRSLFVQSRGALRKELAKHLRTKRLMRRSKHATRTRQGRGQIVDAIPISERPAEIEDRAVPGHWEGDLLCGSKGSCMVTLVERWSRYVMLAKVDSQDSATVVAAITQKTKHLPEELHGSLTWDRGKEMAQHKQFTLATDMKVYFCDPHSPWQRGSNENTNGLLRQYFPKGTDVSVYPQDYLNYIAWKLNIRPRETLGWISPAEKLAQTVAMTG